MADDVKQELENNLAAEEKKNIKVVVKKRVRKTTPKQPSAQTKTTAKKDDQVTDEIKITEPSKTKVTAKVTKAKEENIQLEEKKDTSVEEKTPKAKVARKKPQAKKAEDASNVVEEKEVKAKKETTKKATKPPAKAKSLADTKKVEDKKVKETTPKSHAKEDTSSDKRKFDDESKKDVKQEDKPQRENKPQSKPQSNTQSNRRNPRRNTSQRTSKGKTNKKHYEERFEEINIDENPDVEKLFINDYYYMSFEMLRQKGIEAGLSPDNIYDYKRQEILTEILKVQRQKNIALVVEGTLEVLPDGYGFLRSSINSYISGPEDIYVSANIIRHNALKTGDLVYGQVKTPRDTERFYGLHKLIKVNNDDIIKAKTRPSFDNLIPRFPDERMILENSSEDVSTRLIDMFCPIGKGQRSLIVAPPRTGKTVLMQKIANAISENHPEISLIVLLVDERPEEVTDMKDNVRGEVIASTFDEQATRHVQVAEMAIEKAKRLVEADKDVVILLDSITRLARAYNQTVPASGKILSGGVDSNALHKPKRFFGAARNMEGGGSLTIIATALIETGSRMDEVIFEEFKGTGNNEIVLDRRLSDKRIFPAINLAKSGTRRDDLLIPQDEAQRIWIIRNAINNMDDVDQTPFLIDKMLKSKNNEAFFKSINTTIRE